MQPTAGLGSISRLSTDTLFQCRRKYRKSVKLANSEEKKWKP
jgi:hypothetical protein